MTTDQLRALLPDTPNGPPIEPGWYVVETFSADAAELPIVVVHATPGDFRVMLCVGTADPEWTVCRHEVIRHAPLPDAAALQAEIERLRSHIRATGPDMHAVCPECGPHVRIDEEWCCGVCGADCSTSKCNCADAP